MSADIKKIPVSVVNDCAIELLKLPVLDKSFKGDHIFSKRHMNGAYLAPKQNGKTVLMHNAIDAIIAPGTTKIILFCDTHNKDSYYVELKKKWDRMKINYYAARSFMGVDSEGRSYNDLDTISRMLDKKPAEDYVIIFDDLSTAIKHKSIGELLKKNRHSNIWTFISSQYVMDAKPDVRLNLDYMLLRRTNEEKLKQIYKELGLAVPYEAFLQMYKYATSEPFSFLFVQKDPEEYRINFNKKFDISEILN